MVRFHILAFAAFILVSGSACAADDDISLVVLGVAQDAGYPQAGCYRPHCMRAWNDPANRRLAASIAIIHRGEQKKYLFDATPDIKEQLFSLQKLAPDGEYLLDGVFLTHGHIGHYTGLMHFGHEVMGAHEVPVFAMPRMREFLSTNGPWDQLVRYENILLKDLADGVPVSLARGLKVTPFLVPHRDEYTETVGYRIDGPRRSALFIPDIDKWVDWDTDIRELVKDVDYALVDATFFADGELGDRDMSAIKHPFVSDTMALFDGLPADVRDKVLFIHLNHSNPLLIDGSAAQAEVRRRGFRYAAEGMRLDL